MNGNNRGKYSQQNTRYGREIFRGRRYYRRNRLIGQIKHLIQQILNTKYPADLGDHENTTTKNI